MSIFETTRKLLDYYEEKFNKELSQYVTITEYGIVASEFFEKMRQLYPNNSSEQTIRGGDSE